MKKILGAVGVVLPLVLFCTPVLADRTPEGQCTPATIYRENQVLLKDALEDMRFSTGKVAMKDTPGVYFIEAMIPYCEAGIRLARQAANFSGDADVTRMAMEKSVGETLLLERMQRWGQAHAPVEQLNDSSARSFTNLMEEVRETTWDDMETALSDRDPERSFVTVMAAHGQGAVDMSKVLLIFEADQELRGIAENIIGLQQAGLMSMQSFLKKHQARAVE